MLGFGMLEILESRVEMTGVLEALGSCACHGMAAPRCNSYCCNPDNDAAGPWCFVMDQAG